MTDKDPNFLKRWSSRKTALREEQSTKNVIIPDQADAVHSQEKEEPTGQELEVPDDLPDIETLNKDSDFSLFMREGTPEHLRKLALKKLFNSDPAFAVLDGLNDYDEDYSMVGMVAEAVSTRYKPGHGVVSPEDEKKSDQETKKTPNERSSQADAHQDQLLDQDEDDGALENFDPDNEMVGITEENEIES